jgi:hypothetical protein
MPSESLRDASANCIDGVVLYAALFENLGLEPVIALVPGHAYVGVRLSSEGNHYLYIETSLTGRTPFESAVQAAEKRIATFAAKDIIRVSVPEARRQGIFPLPNSVADNALAVTNTSSHDPAACSKANIASAATSETSGSGARVALPSPKVPALTGSTLHPEYRE